MADQPGFVEVQKYLSGMNYPATRDQLVAHAKDQGADRDILKTLHKMTDREYDGPNEVSKEFTSAS